MLDPREIAKIARDYGKQSVNENEYAEIPQGNYEVVVDDFDIKLTKNSGEPMACFTFKIIAGEFKDRLIWYNQVIKDGMQMGILNSFVRSLDVKTIDLPHSFELETPEQYEAYYNTIIAIANVALKDHNNYQYHLKIEDRPSKDGTKVFRNYKIVQRFEPQQTKFKEEDIPF